MMPSRHRMRVLGACALSCSFVVFACSRGEPPRVAEFLRHARDPNLPLVTVVTPNSAEAIPLVRVLRSELRGSFDVQVSLAGPDLAAEELRGAIDSARPAAVVLVDNSVTSLYRRAIAGHEAPPPAVLVMNSFVEQVQPTIPNSTAIGFEPPAVVSLTHVRSLLERPIRRAGVVYRKGFEGFIEKERARARAEDIELVGIEVAEHPSTSAIGRALHRIERAEPDVVWITNDNVLLSQAALSEAWLPFARKARVPIVVGVPALVTKDGSFGTYAAVPDAEGLGLQTADLLFRLDGPRFHDSVGPVQPPVSIRTYLNVPRAVSLGLAPEGKSRVDVLVDEH